MVFSIFLPISICFGQSGLYEFGNEYAGTQTLYFLELPVSASNISLGGRGLTLDEGATMAFSNPANLAKNKNYLYGFSHGEILGEFRHEYIGAVLPLRNMGSIGLGANVLTSGAIPEYGADDSYLGTFSELDVALGLSYGKYILARTVSAGISLEVLRGQIDDASTFGYGITSGLSWFIGWDLMLATTFHHLSHGVRYDTRRNKLEDIPQFVSVEMGKRKGLGKFAWNLGASSHNSGKKIMYGGGQLFLFNALSINLGYEKKLDDNELEFYSGSSVGVGVVRNGLQVDAGLKLAPPLGNYFYLTLGFTQKGKGDYSERELLLRAKDKYKNGNYQEALIIVENILRRNSKQWTALSLKTKILKELEKEKGNTLSIFYTANTWGQVYPVYENDKKLGGIFRRSTVLKKYRDKFKTSLLVDAGGITLLGSADSMNQKLHEAYGKINYDVINLGLGELRTFPLKLKNNYQLTGNPYVSGNVSNLEWSNAVASHKILVKGGGLNLGVSGVIDPLVLDDSLSYQYVLKEPEIPLNSFNINQRDSVNIWVVCYYGNLEKAKSIAKNYKNIDVIVLGNHPKTLDPPVVVGNTIIVSPGSMGRNLGFLRLNLNVKNKIKSFGNEFIELNRHVSDDPSIAKIFAADPNRGVRQFQKGKEEEIYQEFFPFVRREKSGESRKIYLKNVEKNLDHSFEQKGLDCHSPKLQFSKKRILYLCEENNISVLYSQQVDSKVGIRISPDNMDVSSFQWGLSGNWIFAAASNNLESGLFKFTPTGNQVDRLTSTKLGKIIDFHVGNNAERIAVIAQQFDRDQLWLVDKNFETPLRISSQEKHASKPGWDVTENWLSFVERNPNDRNDESLKLFNLADGQIIDVTTNISIHSYCWGPYGEKIYYSTGVNFYDINVYDINTKVHSKLSNNAEQLRSETNPIPFIYQKRLGILFESKENQNFNIRWVDLEDKKEIKIITLPGENKLF